MAKVWKFGGDAMKDAESVGKVLTLLRGQQVFAVFSAPRGITNLLIDLWRAMNGEANLSFDEVRPQIIRRYESIVAAHCPGKVDVAKEFEEILQVSRMFRTSDYLVSRGEWLMSRIMGVILGRQFVDALDLVVLEEGGKVNLSATKAAVNRSLASMTCAVIPGFYGVSTSGSVQLLPRNSSDVTGSLVAYGLGAAVYEIWKTERVRTADPRIVSGSLLVQKISFVQMYEISDGGAQVVHPAAVFPCHLGRIPIHVRDLNAPEEPGTVIDTDENTREGQPPVIGVAVRKGFVGVTLQRHDMNESTGVMEALLAVFKAAGLPIEHAPTGLQWISVVFHLGDRQLNLLIEEIQRVCRPDALQSEAIEVVTVVGRAVVDGTAHSQIFAALRGFPLLGITQALRGPSISIGVPKGRGEDAVRAVHAALVPVN